MIELRSLRLSVTAPDEELPRMAAKKLHLPLEAITSVRYLKKSVDARKKNDVFYAVTLGVSTTEKEETLVRRLRDPSVLICAPPQDTACAPYPFHDRPVICGAGPAGLFAALTLARAGAAPILIERGADASARGRAIEAFTKTGELDTRTNVQFGEGGAGLFSDGKLTTNVHDPRCRTVLKTFYECGAPEEILYLAKPHIGTDRLPEVVKNLRGQIANAGGEVRFLTRLVDFSTDSNGVESVTVERNGQTERIPTRHLILASGHSARDIFDLLRKKGVVMEPKPFSVGVRIEQDQEAISRAQYGDFARFLPAADYKLAAHLPSGRSVYTFCNCPGGFVVAAASENGLLVVNGMSRFARDGKNANAALLCSVEPSDFAGDALKGIAFQEQYERAAFALGGGSFRAPAQTVRDFLSGRASEKGGRIRPTYPLGVRWTDLSACLPAFASESLKQALPLFGKKIRGFDDPDAVLTGVETRSSSPVRVVRNESCVSSLPGLYPCGEGAGYAGGITSAATDGIRVAQAVCQTE